MMANKIFTSAYERSSSRFKYLTTHTGVKHMGQSKASILARAYMQITVFFLICCCYILFLYDTHIHKKRIFNVYEKNKQFALTYKSRCATKSVLRSHSLSLSLTLCLWRLLCILLLHGIL